MLAASLIFYVILVFVPNETEPQFIAFHAQEACTRSVEKLRSRGLFVSDCVGVTFQTPRTDPKATT